MQAVQISCDVRAHVLIIPCQVTYSQVFLIIRSWTDQKMKHIEVINFIRLVESTLVKVKFKNILTKGQHSFCTIWISR